MEKLFLVLTMFGGKLPDELKQRLIAILEHTVIKKGEFLLRAGGVDRHVWFIEKGLIQIYTSVGNKDVTTYLLTDNDIVVAVDSFESRMPTVENIFALEDTELWFITIEQLKTTCREIIQFFDYYLAIDNHYRKFKDRWDNKLTPEERLKQLSETHPDFFSRIKKEILCSYLKMSEHSYDKLRKEMMNKKKG